MFEDNDRSTRGGIESQGFLSQQGGFALESFQTLKLLSFNIQTGLITESYKDYVTKAWQYILPTGSRFQNLECIAGITSDHDFVALQEIDGGSLRSGFVNQVEYLALRGEFEHWHQQLNRNLGKLAQHGNGILSRFQPYSIEEHELPGIIPGRGAILMRYENRFDISQPLVIVIVHLALSRKRQMQQLAYIADLIEGFKHVILMGDMNTDANNLLYHSPLKALNMQCAEQHNTFPSWSPEKNLDHILVSPNITIEETSVIDLPVSDHCPISMRVTLPDSISI